MSRFIPFLPDKGNEPFFKKTKIFPAFGGDSQDTNLDSTTPGGDTVKGFPVGDPLNPEMLIDNQPNPKNLEGQMDKLRSKLLLKKKIRSTKQAQVEDREMSPLSNSITEIQNQNIQEIDAAKKGTLMVYSQFGELGNIGTAFFISDTLALTAAHVVGVNSEEDVEKALSGSQITCTYNNQEIGARIHSVNYLQDVALIEILNNPTGDKHIFLLDDSDAVKEGTEVMVVGSAEGWQNEVVTGIVSSKDRDISDAMYYKDTPHMMFITCRVLPGMSGAGVVRIDNGGVIGVAVAVVSIEENLGGLSTVLPINPVKDWLNQLGVQF